MKKVKSNAGDKNFPFARFREKYAFYIPESHKNFFSREDMDVFLRARYEFYLDCHEEIKIRVYNPEAPCLWLAGTSVIEILMPDSPFIVDTVVDYCNSQNYHVQLTIHPIFSVQRSEKDRRLLNMDFPDGAGKAESYVYLEINRLEMKELARLKKNIENNLKELRSVVTDYEAMMPLVRKMHFADEFVKEQVVWLADNFVLLGASVLQNQKFAGKQLGVLKKAAVRREIEKELNGAELCGAGEHLGYRETETRSNVNKSRQMYIAILRNSEKTLVLVGHFRNRAELDLRSSVPSIHRMLADMAAELKAPATSYMRKELDKTAQALPVGLLLTRSRELFFPWFVNVLSNMYTTEVCHDLSYDSGYKLVWAEVILPLGESGHFPGRRMRRFLKTHGIETAKKIKYQLNQIELVFLAFRSEQYTPEALLELLKENGHELFSTWSSRFRELVYSEFAGEKQINQLLDRFLHGMSPDYEVHQGPDEVLKDLITLDALTPEKGYEVDYYYQPNLKIDFVKVYTAKQTNLSELVPILTNFGFTINREYAFPFTPEDTTMYTYVFSVPGVKTLDKSERQRISVAIANVLNRKMTSKPINELVRVAGLTARQLDLVKAFCSYYFKINTSFAFSSTQATLVKWPQLTRALVTLFETKFDLDSTPAAVKKARRAVNDSFAQLDSVLEENICKALLNVIEAVMRTNYFLHKPEISFKIKSGLVENIPQPTPLYEIYIYASDMEGIHLRGGAVARGGIRWSDRQDDFRTEVLGLMKAQMVKNTVIVPVGSKGGFVLKHQAFDSRQAFLEAGQATYKRFVTCLLDLTDNLSAGGKVIPARGITRLDGDDPYLVVAADKGTASFSDFANEISLKRKFWLTDAFASGGSEGYDHKKQGITAKGAWEAVKRHFHEVGVNPETDPLTVIAIGDMGGDVFGNGMLLSRSLRLKAAFNHLYIFIDPNPDPVASFEERQRLFEKLGNWDEYDASLISEGGGVFKRSLRKIELPALAREALGIKVKALSGEELIKAILCAPVDLFWNGGIGTYVKDSQETHYQVGDPANDSVRINASQLRAKVVGEGGNLGLTQAARIEAANLGVRLNTDAIDNSAGVNMSDHEVNLKILLDGLCRKKIITQVQRNKIIRKHEQDEIELVLRQNYHNNLGLSLDMLRVPFQFIYFRTLMKFLNRKGILNRELDNIPYEADMDIISQGSRTLQRPVLCALAGFTKLYGYQILLDSDSFYEPWYDRLILRYFPAGVAEKYEKQILAHPLKREIVITEMLNEIVNHAGIAFFQRLHMTTGKPPKAIAHAYMQLSEFLNLNELRTRIETTGEWLNSNIHYEYLLLLGEKVYEITKKLLKDDALLKIVQAGGTGAFSEILTAASRYSSFRLPRKHRILLKMFSKEEVEGILVAFRQMDALEDAFNIFVNNQARGIQWQISDYFSVLQKYRIKELRQITKDMHATSNWEIRFFSKIDTSIEKLITGLINLRISGPAEGAAEKKQRVKRLIGDINVLHARSELSVATLFEMLQHLNEQVLA